MAGRGDERDELSPVHRRGGRVTLWVWLPAIAVIAIVVWLVVRALD